jgi:two-component system, cell cycle sensor histidine kinase and response regulator CckA
MTTILTVDDNEQNLYQLQVLLGANGYQVARATDGAEALAVARQNPPDLIVSDILMPVMDGFSLCREWKKDERLKAVPLIFYTATYTDDRDRQLALDLGAARFVVKPEEPEALLQIIREVLEDRALNGLVEPRKPVGDETVELKEYNQALVRKLEAKLKELDLTRRELEGDVAQRKKTEEELRFRTLVLDTQQEASLDAILVVGESGQVLSFNQRFVDIWEVPSDVLESRSDARLLQSVQHNLVAPEAYLSRVKWLYAHPRETSRDEVPLVDGRILDRYSAPMLGPEGKYYGRVWYFRDVTERRRLEEALRESRQRLISIYDTVGDTIFLVALEADGGFRFESVNRQFVATTGLPAEAIVGKRVEGVIPAASLPLVLNRYRQAATDKAILRWEETSDYPTGRLTGEVSIAPVLDERGRCTHLVGAVHDITARKRAEERQAQTEEMLQQAQKLDSIGRLAGGVAHDFNNLLGVILGYGELMRSQIGEGHPARPRLEQVIGAAQRAADLTRQLLAFSRKQVMQPKLLDLGAVVKDMRRMLDRVVGEDLEIAALSEERLGAVQADPTQIEQVIMNLVVNARDAMPKGGRLTIETSNVDFDESYASTHPTAQAGHFVMLAVSDTGVGMDANTQERIFEPFFTTKAPGEGTGLGLATVYGIVKQMGGHIWVYSEVGHGTSFKVYLPRVEEAVVEATDSAAHEPPPRGHETVLVVEDSQSLRDLIHELLTERGYRVLTVTQGEEALALIREGKHPVDLVLTDLVMPKLGGADLVKRLREIHPDLRVVYMSGYTDGAISRQGVLDEGTILLEKPFAADKLARTVRRALDRQPVDASGAASA